MKIISWFITINFFASTEKIFYKKLDTVFYKLKHYCVVSNIYLYKPRKILDHILIVTVHSDTQVLYLKLFLLSLIL